MVKIDKPKDLNETTYNAYIKVVKNKVSDIEAGKRLLRKLKRTSRLTYNEWVDFIIGRANINLRGDYYYEND